MNVSGIGRPAEGHPQPCTKPALRSGQHERIVSVAKLHGIHVRLVAVSRVPNARGCLSPVIGAYLHGPVSSSRLFRKSVIASRAE